MPHFKLPFRNKSALEQLTLCEQTVAGLTAKLELHHDPTQVTEAQAVVAALRTSLERVESLRGELRMEITRRNQLLAEARGKARGKVYRTSLGVMVKSAGNPQKMMEAGLALPASKLVKVGVPGAPENLRAQPTEKEGEARLMFVRPVRRCTFSIECRRDDEPEGWKRMDSCFRQSAVVEGLQSGVKYWFRVRATNAHGDGPWSNLAVARPK
jgi:hypothetical protein